LATVAGTWNVDGLLGAIPVDLFMEWIEYASFRPIGERAADARAAVLPCMLANMFGKKGSRQRTLDEFLIAHEPKERKQMSADQIDAVLRGAYNKQEEAKRGNGLHRCIS
jgi:hypothetical protein